jgi:hypothetical protein
MSGRMCEDVGQAFDVATDLRAMAALKALPPEATALMFRAANRMDQAAVTIRNLKLEAAAMRAAAGIEEPA